MKKKFIYLLLIVCLISGNEIAAQLPTYTLTAKNFLLQSISFPDDAIEFDVYLFQTNPPVVFNYNGGQYYFSFNSDVLPGNFLDTNIATYRIIGSDLLDVDRPRAPAIITALNPSGTLLRLSVNTHPYVPEGVILTNAHIYPGTKIVRMRLRSKVGSLNSVPLNLQWRNPPATTYATRIWAIDEIFTYDITSPTTHTVDSIATLPVDLVSFNSSVNKNLIKLNWSTLSEQNNFGFEVERRYYDHAVQYNWIKIGFIKGNGTSNILHEYTFKDKALNSGKYNYRLKQVDFNGNFKYYDLQNEVIIGTPEMFFLSQNYPNPFNPVTKIHYELPKDAFVTLKIFDNTGKEIMNVINEFKPAGYYTTSIDGNNFASGVYYYRIESEKYFDVKKMILIK